jgi:hypothetical protein
VAQTFISQFSTGDDGKLYKLSSSDDRNKYHIMSDAEVAEELRMSQEMASTLRTMNPKKPAKQQPATVKLGTGSRAKKIEKRAWEKKLASHEQEQEQEQERAQEGVDHHDTSKCPEVSSEDALLHSVADMQKKYTANLAVIERLISEKVQMEEKVKSVQQELKRSKKLNKFQSAQQFKKNKNEQLVNSNETIQSIDALKTYYHQNLDLIESLYAQQKTTESKLIHCQNELIVIIKTEKENGPKGKSAGVSPSADSILDSAAETNKKYLRNLNMIEQLFAERKSLTTEVQLLKSQLWGLQRSVAMNPPLSPPRHEEVMAVGPAKSSLNHTAPGMLQQHHQQHQHQSGAVDQEIRAMLKEEDGEEGEGEEEELPDFEEEGEEEEGERACTSTLGSSSMHAHHAHGSQHALLDDDPAPSSGGSNVRNVMQLKRCSSPTGKKSSSKDP